MQGSQHTAGAAAGWVPSPRHSVLHLSLMARGANALLVIDYDCPTEAFYGHLYGKLRDPFCFVFKHQHTVEMNI